jgi:NADPH-dependent 2,4-dienoyl-CoA reductase/sulfur reductase-like enzyme/rhodanese-related sulfurtransferase
VGLKLIIVGGVAGGATAAARARRLSEDAEIVLFERGNEISFANCGLPYHVSGEIPTRDQLILQTPETLGGRYALDIRTASEVIAVDPDARTVRVRERGGREYDESYDKLLLAPGAAPIRPPLNGIDHDRIVTLRNVPDTDRMKRLVDDGARSALVVGGGFIGLEVAENLRKRGVDVDLVELLPQVLPPMDPEMATALHDELRSHGVRLHLESGVEAFADADGAVRATLRDGATLTADMVVLAVGVRPDTAFLRDSGLALNERGGIVVDDHMRTSDPHVYAVGDAVETTDAVLGGRIMLPLAGPANRQARIAVDNVFGRDSRFRGCQGTSVVRVFSRTAASTGASEKTLKKREIPHHKVYVTANQHVAYYPGAEPMLLKLLFAPESGRILGMQAVGGDGVDKRIDVAAMAIQAGMTVYDLEEAELAYAPQYGAAKDPINMIGFVASNLLRGDLEVTYSEELPGPGCNGQTLLDVRDEDEFAQGHLPGSILVPLRELRQRLHEVPTDKPIVAICASGQRSYYAYRILQQKGLQSRNLAGGLRVHRGSATPTCQGS